MKSNLLQELEQIVAYEDQMDMVLLIPSYLFVRKYGRSVEAEMPEIAALLGKKEWFFFRADISQEKSILNRFLIEQECKTNVGREYEGCILLELTGAENEKELLEFLNYIESQRQRLTCIYTTRESKEAAEIKKKLSVYGFVRQIDGESFDAFEQLEIFENTLKKYQFSITGGARIKLAEWFRKKKWQEEDAVITQIQNMAKSVIYQKLLNMKPDIESSKKASGEKKEVFLGKEEIENIIQETEGKTETKRQIGFVLEELS